MSDGNDMVGKCYEDAGDFIRVLSTCKHSADYAITESRPHDAGTRIRERPLDYFRGAKEISPSDYEAKVKAILERAYKLAMGK